MTLLTPYFTLCRIYISLFAACSAATGFFLAPGHRAAGVFIPSLAVFILACGASALNQFQERDIDSRMERTRDRPVPSGIIRPGAALFLAFALIITGLALLSYDGGSGASGLGLAALIWYNGVYTGLKKVTAFASLPGAVVGMIPPAIGWTSAGGTILDARLGALCFVFFLWQVPHFWLLLLTRGEEYERAGLPSLTKVLSKAQISRVTFAWIVAASIASLALPLFGSVTSPAVCLAFVPLAAWLIWNERFLAGRRPLLPPSPAPFRNINIYLFLVMSLLSIDRVLLSLP